MVVLSDLPPPITSTQCDLRGYEFMPLFGHRLFNSDFDAQASDKEFRVGLRLWWAAWQQCPAGSLPANDAALRRLAGLGSNVKTWNRLRNVVLRGFIACSDGRLYHPLLCQEAEEAWARRRRDRERKAKMRRGKFPADCPTDGDGDIRGMSHGTESPCPMGQPPLSHGTNPVVPWDINALSHGTGCGCPMGRDADVPVDRTGQKKERKEAAAGADAGLSGRATEKVTARPRMPNRSDPPERWMHLSEKREVDDNGVARPVVAGYYLDGAAEEVCEAACINSASWRGDWRPLIGWLQDGIELPSIVAAVKRVSRRPGYQPPGSLAYFDRMVREQRAS